MPDNRFPKICFEELKRIEYFNPLADQHNWAAQLRKELINLGKENLYNSRTSEPVKSELEDILKIHKEKTKEEDTRRILNSTYNTEYKNITDGKTEPEQYLSFGLRTEVIRTASHLRMKSDEKIHIFANKCTYVVNSTEICSICNLKEEETLEHILFKCPMYNETRTLLAPYINRQNLQESQVNLLRLDTMDKVMRLSTYISTCLKVRSFILNE
ncbi:hypothetical protein M8J76_015191 [Diaphorina citri]|nr:hypothetical protein M8J76_015191 [Diaphorina citri]